jgi:hypothetical protein
MEDHSMATIKWPDYRSDEGRDILKEMMDEIATYEAEIERIRLNYEATGWKTYHWSEPPRARRIRAKQRVRQHICRLAEIIWQGPVGTMQAFERGSEVGRVHTLRRYRSIMSKRVTPAKGDEPCETEPNDDIMLSGK